jgi:hypothetical protein
MKSLAVIGAMYFELKPLLRHLDVTHQWKEKETHIFQTQYVGQSTGFHIANFGFRYTTGCMFSADFKK